MYRAVTKSHEVGWTLWSMFVYGQTFKSPLSPQSKVQKINYEEDLCFIGPLHKYNYELLGNPNKYVPTTLTQSVRIGSVCSDKLFFCCRHYGNNNF